MSELKVILATPHPKMKNACDGAIEVYPKEEADKVIAEKEKEIAELQDKVTDLLLRDRNMALNFNNAIDALVHNKYKRCLAMAMWCSAELGMLVSTWEFKIKHYKKWQKRWLKIAEQFKEAK